MATPTLADRLLDAQVAWAVARLTGPALPALLEADVDDLLAVGGRVTVGSVVDAERLGALVRLVFERVPPSAAAATVVELVADLVHDGPAEPFTIGEVVEREQVAALADELLARTDVLQELLDDLSHNPMVAGLAARFVVQVAGSVLQANRAAAEKVPGVGSLMSFGAGAAGKVFGIADKQVEALLGDTAGKGAGFAMRRLNAVVVETLRSPATREAVLEAYDRYAERPVQGAERTGTRDDTHRVAGLVQDVVITAAVSAPVLALADGLVAGFLDVYGDEPVASLLDDLGLTRDDLVAQAQSLVPPLLDAAAASGDLDRIMREHLAPFFASDEVAALLAES